MAFDYIDLFDTGSLDMRAILAGECEVFRFTCHNDFWPEQGWADVKVSLVNMRGQITNNAGYIRLEGEISVDFRTPCARCAAELERTLTFRVEKDIVVQDQLNNEEDGDDYLIVTNGSLNLRTLMEEEVCLQFPSRILCKEDCRGLCSKCGKNLNEGPCSCPEREIDPRLAPLSKWKEKT